MEVFEPNFPAPPPAASHEAQDSRGDGHGALTGRRLAGAAARPQPSEIEKKIQGILNTKVPPLRRTCVKPYDWIVRKLRQGWTGSRIRISRRNTTPGFESSRKLGPGPAGRPDRKWSRGDGPGSPVQADRTAIYRLPPSSSACILGAAMAQMQLPWLTARLDPCEISLQLKPSNRKFPNVQPFQTQPNK